MRKVEIIIPAKDNDGADNSALIKQVIRQFCGLFGGATVYDATGYWVNPQGKLYEDHNKVIVAAALESDESSETIRAIAREILALTDQESVFISDGSRSEIIE